MPITTTRSPSASAIKERIIAYPKLWRCSAMLQPPLRALSMSLVPKRVHLERFAGDDAVTSLQPGDDPRVAGATPRRDRDLAMLEQAGADFNERIVIVDVEYERVLRYYQRDAGPRDDCHLGEHLRFQLAVDILHLATDLRGVRARIDVGADPRNHPLERLLGKCSRDGLKLLSDVNAREVVLVDIAR